MRKVLCMLAVALISVGCFAQKSNVNKAKNLSASYENPDFDGARAAIRLALEDPSTKDLANTWYVAGLIGYKEMDYANVQMALGQQYDNNKVGAAVNESYDYWLKADELSQIPNAKGKVDASTRKNISTRMLEYYQKMILITYGYSLYENHDYAAAYKMFMKHLDIPSLPMMQDKKLQEQMPKDTLYYTYLYYAGRFAYQAQMYNEAISIFKKMISPEVREVALHSDVVFSNEFLYQCYADLKDTVAYVGVLQDAIKLFPDEPWFIQNLINHYIFSGQKETAIDYLTEAIKADPTIAQYYHIRGNIYESLERFDEAVADFNKALELDPKLADAQAGLGRVYYNKASKMNDEVIYISDKKAYEQGLKQMNEIYLQSLPYFEKAHEMAPDNRDYMIILKGLYYRFHMDDKYQQITDEMNK